MLAHRTILLQRPDTAEGGANAIAGIVDLAGQFHGAVGIEPAGIVDEIARADPDLAPGADEGVVEIHALAGTAAGAAPAFADQATTLGLGDRVVALIGAVIGRIDIPFPDPEIEIIMHGVVASLWRGLLRTGARRHGKGEQCRGEKCSC